MMKTLTIHMGQLNNIIKGNELYLYENELRLYECLNQNIPEEVFP